MRSKTIERLMKQMENDPWHVKLRRWYRVKVWTYMCLTRKYWDKSFEDYIFKKRCNHKWKYYGYNDNNYWNLKECIYCGKSSIERGNRK